LRAASVPAFQALVGPNDAFGFALDFPQIFSHSPYMFTRDLIGGFGLTFRDGGEQPFVLMVDLVLVMRACIKMFDGGEHTSERQFTERFQQMREHSVVGSFADGTVKRVIKTGMFL